jgi:hypothetical protein
MDSNGVPGRIQVTHAVYLGLRERYQFEERCSVPIKGKGDMTTTSSPDDGLRRWSDEADVEALEPFGVEILCGLLTW